jgi:uncharacterized membrane protein (UPF0127 family)
MTAAPISPLTVHHARGWCARLAGLLGHAELRKGEALVLAPCRGVHTWFMPYAIDVVFVDHDGRVLKVVTDLPPWRVAMCRGAHAAIELRAGQASLYGLAAGVCAPSTVLER